MHPCMETMSPPPLYHLLPWPHTSSNNNIVSNYVVTKPLCIVRSEEASHVLYYEALNGSGRREGRMMGWLVNEVWPWYNMLFGCVLNCRYLINNRSYYLISLLYLLSALSHRLLISSQVSINWLAHWTLVQINSTPSLHIHYCIGCETSCLDLLWSTKGGYLGV